MNSDNIHIANIGCRFYRKNPKQTGGVVVLFEQWLEYCSSLNNLYSFTTIDSNKSNYKHKLIGLFSIFKQTLKFSRIKASKKIVILHATYFDVIILLPLIRIICKVSNIKIILRKFGGNFESIYHSKNILIKKFIHHNLCSISASLWESKSLVNFGKVHNIHSYWFPNVRYPSEYIRDLKNSYNHKFVFISRVEKEKGIIELSNIVSQLGYPYSLDIYGPVAGVDIETIVGSNVKYKGILKPDEITKTLCSYDVLCLPTYWKGEGYPGIIIEAFSAGIPVISTFQGGIPELITHKQNGLLFPAKDKTALMECMTYFNKDNYYDMSVNALDSFTLFDANIVNRKILNLILSND